MSKVLARVLSINSCHWKTKTSPFLGKEWGRTQALRTKAGCPPFPGKWKRSGACRPGLLHSQERQESGSFRRLCASSAACPSLDCLWFSRIGPLAGQISVRG